MRSANFGWLKLCEIWSSNYKQKEKRKKGKRKKEKMGLCKVDYRLETSIKKKTVMVQEKIVG